MNLPLARTPRAETGSVFSTRPSRPANRKRIMMIAPHFEEYALHLCLALADGAEVLLATSLARLRRDYEDRPFPDMPGVTLRDAPFRSPADGLRLLANVIRFRPAVLHIQEAAGLRKAMICALVVAAARSFCRIVLTVHDPIPHEGRDAAVARRLNRFRRFTRRSADAVFVHGDYCRDEYLTVRENRVQSVIVVDHGTILADRPPAPPRLTDRPLSILCFGRMEEYKGLGVFLAALQQLHARGIAPDVLVAGTGPEMDLLQKEFARLANVRVENAFISSRRLIDALEKADLVVMPYLTATQSGVLAATFANGRFVVASRVGGIPDIVDDGVNGLLVPPDDAAALAGALEHVAHDPGLRHQLSEGARRTAEDRLRWATITARMLAHY